MPWSHPKEPVIEVSLRVSLTNLWAFPEKIKGRCILLSRCTVSAELHCYQKSAFKGQWTLYTYNYTPKFIPEQLWSFLEERLSLHPWGNHLKCQITEACRWSEGNPSYCLMLQQKPVILFMVQSERQRCVDMTLNWEHVRKLQGSHRGEMDTSMGSMDWDDRWLCSNMNISELWSRSSSSLSSTEKQNCALGRRI